MLEIMQQPDKHAQPIGRIVEVLGNYADPGMEIEIALRKHDLPYEFPKDVERQAKAISPVRCRGRLGRARGHPQACRWSR